MRFVFYVSLLALCSLYALLRGGAPERTIAISYFATWILDRWVHYFTPAEYAEMDPGHLVIDFIIWISFFIVAMRARRFWPLCLVSLQTIALVAHTAKLMDVTIVPRAYFVMQYAVSYPVLITLAIGTYCHQRRLKIYGTDPPWRNS
ncbi:hypothetical protein [Sphingorhabdus sp. EL138]|uniref:hypothetical protein n=1 Tax=Sphingorhabdus sp. EL138 TaxID=2073156 RepID=UPI0020B1053D|nr:hypothetical protein [Sphingorhabdus sp. EL138]